MTFVELLADPYFVFSNQRAFRSSATDGGEASVETDAIEDIFRLFIIEEVKHDAGAYPRSAEQLSANTGHSNVSCENKTEVMSQQPLDPESTTCRGQKQAATTKVLGDSQYRIRRPLSG